MRLNNLRQMMETLGYQAILITEPHNIRYLSGFSGSAASLLITLTQQWLLTDYRYVQQATDESPAFDIICRDRSVQTLGQCIGVTLKRESVNCLHLEYAHLNVELYLQLQHDLPWSLQPATNLVEQLRARKDASELNYIRRAADIADAAFNWLLPQLKVGMTEQEAATLLEQKLFSLGAEKLAFPTILLSGERTALPHGKPGNRAFCAGDWLLLDFGAEVQGYRSDMTRTLVLGKASAEQQQFYQTVFRAQQAALNAARAGITGHQLWLRAYTVLNNSPYATYAGEGLGHGVGLALHEFPLMRNGCNAVLQAGMVITVEPGLYMPGFGGVRIEDDIVITDTGYELLTHSPKQLIELPV